MADEDQRLVPDAVAELYRAYEAARSTASEWSGVERKLKTRLLLALGYDPADPKPPAMTTVNAKGESVFRVAVTYRKSLDTAYFREKYPQVYAECERTTPAKSIKPVE